MTVVDRKQNMVDEVGGGTLDLALVAGGAPGKAGGFRLEGLGGA